MVVIVLMELFFLLQAENTWYIYRTSKIIPCTFIYKQAVKEAALVPFMLHTYQPAYSASHLSSFGLISPSCATLSRKPGISKQNARCNSHPYLDGFSFYFLQLLRGTKICTECHMLTVVRQYLCIKPLAQKYKSYNFEAMMRICTCLFFLLHKSFCTELN